MLKWQASLEVYTTGSDTTTMLYTTEADTFAEAYEDILDQIGDTNGRLMKLETVYKFWYEEIRRKPAKRNR